MVVVMKERATDEQIQRVIAQLIEMGFDVHRSTGALKTVIGAVGGNRQFDPALFEVIDGVQEVASHHRALQARQPQLQAREHGHHHRRSADRRRRSRSSWPGRARPRPRSRSRRRAAAVKHAGAKVLRGGAFKPRSSPYSFQGLGEEGLRMLRAAADRHNLKLVSEVMDISQLEPDREILAHPAGRRAQHAELHAAARARSRAERRCCSSAASRPRSKSGCSRPSTSSPAAT